MGYVRCDGARGGAGNEPIGDQIIFNIRRKTLISLFSNISLPLVVVPWTIRMVLAAADALQADVLCTGDIWIYTSIPSLLLSKDSPSAAAKHQVPFKSRNQSQYSIPYLSTVHNSPMQGSNRHASSLTYVSIYPKVDDTCILREKVRVCKKKKKKGD